MKQSQALRILRSEYSPRRIVSLRLAGRARPSREAAGAFLPASFHQGENMQRLDMQHACAVSGGDYAEFIDMCLSGSPLCLVGLAQMGGEIWGGPADTTTYDAMGNVTS
jgi:hypothetical protein